MKVLKNVIAICLITTFGISRNTSAMFASKERKEKSRCSTIRYKEEEKKRLKKKKQKLVNERIPHFETILKTFAALAGVTTSTSQDKTVDEGLNFYSKILARASCTKKGFFCLLVEDSKVIGRLTLGNSTECFDFTQKRKKEPKNLKKRCKKLLDSINAVTFSTLSKEGKMLKLLVQGSKNKKTYSVVFKRDFIDNPQYSQYGAKRIGKTIELDKDGKKIKNKYQHATIFSIKDHSGMPKVEQSYSSEYRGVEFD